MRPASRKKSAAEAGLLKELANAFLVIAGEAKSAKFSEPNWYLKKFKLARRPEFRFIATLKKKPLRVERTRLIESGEECAHTVSDLTVSHSAENSDWVKGEVVIFKLFELLQQPNYGPGLQAFIRHYTRELLEQHHHGDHDNRQMLVNVMVTNKIGHFEAIHTRHLNI